MNSSLGEEVNDLPSSNEYQLLVQPHISMLLLQNNLQN